MTDELPDDVTPITMRHMLHGRTNGTNRHSWAAHLKGTGGKARATLLGT